MKNKINKTKFIWVFFNFSFLCYMLKSSTSYNLNNKHLFTLYNNNITRLDRSKELRDYQYKLFHPPFRDSEGGERERENALLLGLQQGATSFALLFLVSRSRVLSIDLADQIIENLLHVNLVLC